MTMFDSNRRSFLKGACGCAGGLLLGSIIPKRAMAQVAGLDKKKFVFCYFEGGWDILLGLDPRDPATVRPDTHQIDPGYGQIGAQYLARGTNGVQRSGALSFGPAVPPEFVSAHGGSVNVINAISMDTASHEVGRRFFITGRFPRGIAAVGSSTAAEIVAQLGDHVPIPHMSAAVEAYATGLPAYASALGVNSLADLIVALTPFVAIDPTVQDAVRAYQNEPAGCAATKLDRDGLASRLLRGQQRARGYIESMLSETFNVQRTDAEMMALRQLYGMEAVGYDPTSPELLSFVGAQALKQNISQAVSVRVALNLDTHSNWAQDQPAAQERGWRALGALMTDLKNTPATDGSANMFEQTTFVVFSEFARTPMFNNLQGRDHFLGNSAMAWGPGLKKGVAIGKSADIGMSPLMTELATGAGIANPTQEQQSNGSVVALSPRNVLATVLSAAGLDYSYLRADPIRALLA
jgi:uncharacterized protein (DUF1501 family)